VILFISMRRGGRFIYAIDVSVPDAPKFLWKFSADDLGHEELGYSWSAPRLVETNANNGDPILMFAAGYDPTVEDVDPSTISAISSTTMTAGATYTRTMGRGFFALDAATGNILWQAGPSASDPTSDPSVNHHYEVVSGLDYAIPSDMTVISDRSSSTTNRGYVGDTGGNIWRIDFDDSNVANWEVTKLASIADHSDLPAQNRKFLFSPDVVYSDDGYDAVLIGSGDREHPFDEDVENRFYMFKDTNIGTSVDGSFSTLRESDLFDATSNCIQDADACSGLLGQADENPDTAIAALTSADGWYITLGEGEKVVGNAVTLNSVTFFNTNQPSSAVASSDCSSDLGIARQYKSYEDATAILDQNIDGDTTAADRSSVHSGGGYLPSPVPVMVEIDGEVHEGVISGIAVDQPPGSLLNARLRRFWYKEIE
jgi:type IV pilus assembly protein PilY1